MARIRRDEQTQQAVEAQPMPQMPQAMQQPAMAQQMAQPMQTMQPMGTVEDTPTELRDVQATDNAGLPEVMTGGRQVTEQGVQAAPAGPKIGRDQVIEAQMILNKYREGKANLERRVRSAQNWWRRENYKEIVKDGKTRDPETKKNSTGWLFNSIIGKHADVIDSYPEPVILPRAEDDKQEADRLCRIVPVVLEQNGFEQVYSDVAWQKMQEGTGIYSVCWDKNKLNGIGDISIKRVSILNLFWQPGVADIQDSRNVFCCSMMDNDLLEQQYPDIKDHLNGNKLTVAKYDTEDKVDTDGKSLVIDWYYHRWDGQRKVLHYVKFCGDVVLYATENDPQMEQTGLYDDANYPFVFDVQFPVEGSPAGFGYIDAAKDIQEDIDLLNEAMVLNTIANSRPRYMERTDGSINEAEFLDFTKPIVHVNGSLDEAAIRRIELPSLPSYATSMLTAKVDEIKFVTGNTDVQNGGAPSGVTAASGIAALQETSGRSSRDSNKNSYRAYARIVTMVIERIRQFYEMPRMFRIMGSDGQEQFVQYDNAGLQPQQMMAMGNDMGLRLPVFDVEVGAQRENPYTKAAQNELAIQMYQLGTFNPAMADQAVMLLEMMDFKDKDKLLLKVRQNGTLVQMANQLGAIALVLASKYEPQTAAQVQQMLASNPATAQIVQQMQAQQGMPGGRPAEGAAESSGNMSARDAAMKGGETRMDNMRDRVNAASRPNE